LIRQGLTVRQAVSILYLLAMLFAVVGLLMIFIRLRYSLVLLGVIGLNLALLSLSFGLHRAGPAVRLTDDTVARLPRWEDAELLERAGGEGQEKPGASGGQAS
jgi:hypothetical protein